MQQSNSLKKAKVSEAEIEQAKATEAKIAGALKEFLSVTEVMFIAPPVTPKVKAGADQSRDKSQRRAQTAADASDNSALSSNIAFKFFHIKPSTTTSETGHQCITDSTVVNLFYSSKFMPNSWDSLSAKERTIVISRALATLSPLILQRFRIDQGRPSNIGKPISAHTKKTTAKDPQVATETISVGSDTPVGTSSTLAQSGENKIEQIKSPVTQEGDSTTPVEISRDSATPSSVKPEIAPRQIEQFTWKLVSKKIISLPISNAKVKNCLEEDLPGDTVLDLLNLPHKTIVKALNSRRTDFNSLTAALKAYHPGVALLFEPLENLGISPDTIRALNQIQASKVAVQGETTTPIATENWLSIDTAFRLLLAPQETIKLLSSAEHAAIAERFYNAGWGTSKA